MSDSSTRWAFGASEEQEYTPVRPPRALLVAAAVAVLVGIALFGVSVLSAHVAGYVLSSFVCMGLIATFMREDAKRRHRQPRYSPQPALGPLSTVIVSLGIMTASVHVWFIATELAVR